jgi:hypothetical protein
MKEKGILRAQAVVREQAKRHAQRTPSDRHGFRATPPDKVVKAAAKGTHTGSVAKSFAKATGKHFAKFAASGAGKAIGAVAKRAGPVGLAYGAAVGAVNIGKAAGHGIMAVSAHRDLDVLSKKSKAKYGTLRAAAATRRAMTGK